MILKTRRKLVPAINHTSHLGPAIYESLSTSNEFTLGEADNQRTISFGGGLALNEILDKQIISFRHTRGGNENNMKIKVGSQTPLYKSFQALESLAPIKQQVAVKA
ncbi:MAG: hypothetical protein ACI9S8_000532, partial [Chlamydiales bacterium]